MRIVIGAVVTAMLGAVLPAQGEATIRKAADDTLAMKDNVEASRRADSVFYFADALLAKGKRKEAIKYLQGGLRLSPFRLEYQLSLAKALSAEKDAKGAAAAADIVTRRAEDDWQIVDARAVLGQPMPETSISPLTEAPKTGLAVILLPVGDCDVALMQEAGRLLASKLGITVVAAKFDVILPKVARDPYAEMILNLRVQLRATAKKDGKPLLDRLKLKVEDLEDESRLIMFARALAAESSDPTALPKLNRDLRWTKAARQWEAEKLQEAVASATAAQRRTGLAYLGVTKNDMFMKNTNYVFGLSGSGGGIASYARFRGEFNDDPPDRKRLLNRLLKQGMSTIGFLFGLPRCTSPDCARAYPNSLQEHDSKSDELCADCKAAWQKVLASQK